MFNRINGCYECTKIYITTNPYQKERKINATNIRRENVIVKEFL